ncbi:MAG: GGDEF domain-containing protein [Gammaproteobacteria bacterium]|nr:GGDEF domain-containing protein [Gammaproteobacteria bacterium]
MRAVLRLLVALAVPVLLLWGAHLLRGQLDALPGGVRVLVPWLPYLLLFPGMLLALLFGRGRAFFLLLVLAGFYLVLSQPPEWQVHGARLDVDALQLGLAFLVPLAVALFAWWRERGVFTRHGAIRWAAVLAPAGLVAMLATSRPRLLDPLRATPFDLARIEPGMLLTEPVLIALALAAGLLLVRYGLTREPLALNLVGTLAALVLALQPGTDPHAAALFIAAGGVLILLAIVHDSYRMAYRDELTGLPGRRALQEDLAKLGSRYAIAMLDVDHFKQFNDRHGHDVGDQVLKLVAARMREVRGGGRPYRYGGEEFTVLFPGKRAEQALPHLERLRETIADSTFLLRGKNRPKAKRTATSRGRGRRKRVSTGRGNSVSVTVSIGVAERDARHPLTGDVIRKADQALYLAKGAGRNRVCS